VKEAAYTIKRHWDGVLNWFKSRINNGILEGFNSLVQAAKARARGYRTTEYLITMIYLLIVRPISDAVSGISTEMIWMHDKILKT
jgi:transposase